MNILRGGFRLSIAIALAAGATSAWQTWMRHAKAREKTWETISVMECATKVPVDRLTAIVNEFGNFDVQRVYCASRPYFTNFKEIEEA